MLTRREFTRLAMAGAASQVVSPLLAQGGDRKIGYGIIGLGRISMDHFMPGVLASKNSKITGLVSGHRDKALAQAAKYGVPESSIYSYENMDEFKNNPAIDAVYVALPNSMHAEYTIRSATRGQARAVRKADGDHGCGFNGDDQGLQRGEQEADDCLSLPLRADESARDAAYPGGQAGQDPGDRERERLQGKGRRMAA